jgi:hypothetical protein
MLHVYALVRHPASVPDVLGIDDGPLRVVVAGHEVDAVVSDTRAGIVPSEAAILAHARVVEAVAAANESVLPARFAGDLSAEADVGRILVERRERILAALDRVDGCVELGLRVLPAEGDVRAKAPSGGEYMRTRLGEVARARHVADTLQRSLAAVARESTSNVLARRDVLLTAAYLVPRGDLERFHAAVKDVERQLSGVTVVSTGPWPPYSFALLEADDG